MDNQAETSPLLRAKEMRGVKWIPVYTGSVAVVGFAIIAYSFTKIPSDVVGLFLFAGMAFVAELGNVELFKSSRSRVSVSSIIATASIFALGPTAGVFTHMISGITTAIASTFRQRGEPSTERASWFRRTAFNIGMFVTSAFAAGWVYAASGGTFGHVAQVANIPAMILAVTVDVLLNIMILIGVISLQTARKPVDLWKQDFQWAAPIAVFGGVLGGGVMAISYDMFNFLGLAVVFLPVLSTGYSFRLYVNNMKGYVEKLEQANAVLEEANLGLLETLGEVIDAYDVYTYGHSAQVATYASAIAEEMNLGPERCALVVRAALAHDVGKVGVMDAIVSKRGFLTDAEYNAMKRHPIIGADIVGRMEGLSDLVPIVRHHHERWDGRGYPDGLIGEEIPFETRILTLADSLDAMFSDRPYRATRSFREVLEEVQRCAGSQFDPDVVEIFVALAAKKGRGFFRNSSSYVEEMLRANSTAEEPNLSGYFLKRSMLPETQEG